MIALKYFHLNYCELTHNMKIDNTVGIKLYQ